MNFLALHDDVKFIISAHLASDLKIRALLDLKIRALLLRKMMILKMQKYSRYIKISHIQEMSYILVVRVIH